MQFLSELEMPHRLRQSTSLSLPPTPRPRNFARTKSVPNSPHSLRSKPNSPRFSIPRAQLSISRNSAFLSETSSLRNFKPDPETF